MYEQTRIACRHIMALSKGITLDFVGVRYFKMFKYVSLRNDSKNELFQDVMKRFESIYNDNHSGIRFSKDNRLFPEDIGNTFPKGLKGNVSYEVMKDIMNWTNSQVVKNFENHVLPNGENDFKSLLHDKFDVPLGLSQQVLLSSQCCDKEDAESNILSENVNTTKQTFFSRVKPVFDEILKQVETNPDISDDVHAQFQHILNYTKENNSSQTIEHNVAENDNSNAIVSYHGKLDNRYRAKRFKYGWEK